MIVLVWLHILAAVAWIGGMLFLSLILVPVFKREGFAGERRVLFQTLAVRFRMVVWVSITVLVTTGSLLLTARVGSLAEPGSWPLVLKLKLVLVVLLIALTAVHDFWLGPKVAELMRASPANRGATEQMLVRLSPWIARLGLVLALIILLLAVAVARTERERGSSVTSRLISGWIGFLAPMLAFMWFLELGGAEQGQYGIPKGDEGTRFADEYGVCGTSRWQTDISLLDGPCLALSY